MTPRDRSTLVREIQLLTAGIAGEFQPDKWDGVTLAPGVRCPEPADVPVAAMRRLHAALVEFISEAR